MGRPLRVPPSPALQDLYAREQALGGNPLEMPPPPGPPVKNQPLLPPIIPPPDWRAEQEQRARLEAAEQAIHPHGAAALEAEPQPYPAKRQERPKRTPNLDRVRKWRKEIQ